MTEKEREALRKEITKHTNKFKRNGGKIQKLGYMVPSTDLILDYNRKTGG